MICYAAYMLAKNPTCLSRLRQEHDIVLGSVSETPKKIRNDPYVLNKLEYTYAFIRETLRLWPAASSMWEWSEQRVGDGRAVQVNTMLTILRVLRY